jgi:hypothetical protein
LQIKQANRQKKGRDKAQPFDSQIKSVKAGLTYLSTLSECFARFVQTHYISPAFVARLLSLNGIIFPVANWANLITTFFGEFILTAARARVF